MRGAGTLLIPILAIVPQMTMADGIGGPGAASDWTGFYAGAQFGMLDSKAYATLPPITGDLIYEGNGMIYGLHAGYLHDFGRFVVGAEAEVNFANIDETFVPGGAPGGSIDRNTLVKVKVGIDAGRFMPYAIAGYGWLGTVNAVGGDMDYKGPAYGLGVSYMLSEQMLVGAEIVRQDLDGIPPISLNAHVTTATLRASWRF